MEKEESGNDQGKYFRQKFHFKIILGRDNSLTNENKKDKIAYERQISSCLLSHRST